MADRCRSAGHAKPNHDYHLVNPSPWPFVGSISAFVLAIGAICYFRTRTSRPWLMLIGFAGVLYTMYAWWSDVIKEGQRAATTPRSCRCITATA